jgi:hypothetical protein
MTNMGFLVFNLLYSRDVLGFSPGAQKHSPPLGLWAQHNMSSNMRNGKPTGLGDVHTCLLTGVLLCNRLACADEDLLTVVVAPKTSLGALDSEHLGFNWGTSFEARVWSRQQGREQCAA